MAEVVDWLDIAGTEFIDTADTEFIERESAAIQPVKVHHHFQLMVT